MIPHDHLLFESGNVDAFVQFQEFESEAVELWENAIRDSRLLVDHAPVLNLTVPCKAWHESGFVFRSHWHDFFVSHPDSLKPLSNEVVGDIGLNQMSDLLYLHIDVEEELWISLTDQQVG